MTTGSIPTSPVAGIASGNEVEHIFQTAFLSVPIHGCADLTVKVKRSEQAPCRFLSMRLAALRALHGVASFVDVEGYDALREALPSRLN